MTLTAAALESALRTHRQAGIDGFNGPLSDSLFVGIANGFITWAIASPTNLALTGAAAGTVGTGAINPVTTSISVPNDQFAVRSGLEATGITGPISGSLAQVVAAAISTVFAAFGQYSGTSPSVATGQDVSLITTANSGTLTTALQSALTGTMGGSGPLMPTLASGLAIGIASQLLGASGTGTVTGVAGPSPASGLTNSVVL
jgi:hypothetical protein